MTSPDPFSTFDDGPAPETFWGRWRARWRNRRRSSGIGDCDPFPVWWWPGFGDCSVPDCNMPDCDVPDCDGCDAGGCDLPLLILGVSLLGYFRTPPVREGRVLTRPVLRLIRSYQRHVSAHRPAVCNLSPTCSAYGYEALRVHGLVAVPLLRRRLRECRVAGLHRPAR